MCLLVGVDMLPLLSNKHKYPWFSSASIILLLFLSFFTASQLVMAVEASSEWKSSVIAELSCFTVSLIASSYQQTNAFCTFAAVITTCIFVCRFTALWTMLLINIDKLPKSLVVCLCDCSGNIFYCLFHLWIWISLNSIAVAFL